MSVAAAIALVILAAIIALLAYELVLRRDRRQAPRRMRLYVVGERGTEATLEGIFLGFEADHYRLASAVHVQAEDDPVPLAGEAWVPRSHVLYAQIVG